MKFKLASVLAAVGLASGIGGFASQAHAQVMLRSQLVVSGLSFPVGVYSIPGDTNRIFVVQQGGIIRTVDLTTNTVNATKFLDLSSTGLNVVTTSVGGGSERGLLGLAFDPNYTTNGYFYVYFTDRTNGSIRIERFTATGAPFANAAAAYAATTANTASRLTMLNILHPSFANHNGGSLVFGADGMLYAGVGDGGSGGDPNENAQNLDVLLGKILRLDPSDTSAGDGDAAWVPNDNPFRDAGGVLRPYIWAYGVRNPWRIDKDRLTSDLYIADVGQDTQEEINFQPSYVPGPGGNFAQVAGRNYGWDCREGWLPQTVDVGCDPNASGVYTDPFQVYTHGANGDLACSITGGVIYRGSAIPELVGTYFHADYCGGWVRNLRYNPMTGTFSELKDITAQLRRDNAQSVSSIVDFGEDASGEVYIVSSPASGSPTGAIFRIVKDTTECGCPCVLQPAAIPLFIDNAETDHFWTFSQGSTVTDGGWERAVPVDDHAIAYDPYTDSDGSGKAFVTDNAAGNSDVDSTSSSDNAVVMTSTRLDWRRGQITLCYDYYLYLSQTGGTDPDGLFVEVSSDDGANWTRVASHTSNNVTGWFRESVTPAEFQTAGVTFTNQMRVRFLARDNLSTAASIVEAGVDNIQIHTGNPIPCDFDGSGAVGVADLFGFLDTWFTEFATPGAGLGSDFNYDGGVGVADLFQFLDCWFANFN